MLTVLMILENKCMVLKLPYHHDKIVTSLHCPIELTFKTLFYGESDVIIFRFDSECYVDPILR